MNSLCFFFLLFSSSIILVSSLPDPYWKHVAGNLSQVDVDVIVNGFPTFERDDWPSSRFGTAVAKIVKPNQENVFVLFGGARYRRPYQYGISVPLLAHNDMWMINVDPLFNHTSYPIDIVEGGQHFWTPIVGDSYNAKINTTDPYPENYNDYGKPSFRYDSSMVYFPPKLYLFGGYHQGGNPIQRYVYNDLWTFDFDVFSSNSSANLWSWINGCNSRFSNRGNYQINNQDAIRKRMIKGIYPHGRGAGLLWLDVVRRRFFLFGGYDANYMFDDLWEYLIDSNTWAWLDGHKTPKLKNSCDCYSVMCSYTDEPDSCNPGDDYPLHIKGSALITHPTNNGVAYIFGGYNIGGSVDELWLFTPKYDPSSHSLALLTENRPLSYFSLVKGTRYVYNNHPSITYELENPGARSWSVGWWDNDLDIIWIYGGFFIDITDTNVDGYAGDLWGYSILNDRFQRFDHRNLNQWLGLSPANCPLTYVYEYWSNTVSPENYNIPGVRSSSAILTQRYIPKAYHSTAVSNETTYAVYLFGGEGAGEFDSTPSNYRCFGVLNDLWQLRDVITQNTFCYSKPNLDPGLSYIHDDCDSSYGWRTGEFCPVKCNGVTGYVNDGSYYHCTESNFINDVNCFDCPSGNYIQTIDYYGYSCTLCPPGFMNLYQNGFSCTECPEGFYSKYGADNCTDLCPIGHYCPTGTSFYDLENFECPENTYCPQGRATPLDCPSNTYSLTKSRFCHLLPSLTPSSNYSINEDEVKEIHFYLSQCNITLKTPGISFCYQDAFISLIDKPSHGDVYYVNISSPFVTGQGYETTLLDSKTQGAPSLADTIIRYVPDKDYFGTDTFSMSFCFFVQTNDHSGDILCHPDVHQVSIDIISVNDPPVFTTSPIYFINGRINLVPLNLWNYIFDAENSTVSIYFQNLPENGYLYLHSIGKVTSFSQVFSLPYNEIIYFIPNENNERGSIRKMYTSFEVIPKDDEDLYGSVQNVTIYITCELTYYIHNWGSGDVCATCPEGGICDSTAKQYPISQPGFWSSDIEPSIFLPCIPADACPQGSGFGTGICKKGYTGKRCGACDAQYYRLSETCIECPDAPTSAFYLVLGTIVIVSVVALMIFLASQKEIAFVTIALTYIQVLAVISKINLNWPPIVLGAFQFMSVFNLNIELLALECQFFNFQVDWVLKYVFWLVLPLIFFVVQIILILLYFLWCIFYFILTCNKHPDGMWGYCKEQTVKFFFLNVKGSLLFLSFIYIAIASAVAEIFDCTRHNDGSSYMDADPSNLCYDDRWWSIMPFGIIGTIVYLVGIPCFFIIVLLRRPVDKYSRTCCCGCLRTPKFFMAYQDDDSKKKIFDDHNINPDLIDDIIEENKELVEVEDPEAHDQWNKKYKSLIKVYDKRCYYWEIMILIRKLAISGGKIFASKYPMFQATIAIFILFISILFQVRYEPYPRSQLNWLEFTCLFTSIIMVLGGVLAYGEQSMNNDDTRFYMGLVMTFFFVAAMIYVIFDIVVIIRLAYSNWQRSKTIQPDDDQPDIPPAKDDIEMVAATMPYRGRSKTELLDAKQIASRPGHSLSMGDNVISSLQIHPDVLQKIIEEAGPTNAILGGSVSLSTQQVKDMGLYHHDSVEMTHLSGITEQSSELNSSQIPGQIDKEQTSSNVSNINMNMAPSINMNIPPNISMNIPPNISMNMNTESQLPPSNSHVSFAENILQDPSSSSENINRRPEIE